MTTEPSLTQLLSNFDPEERPLTPRHLYELLQTLAVAESPGSFRTFFWILIQALENDSDLRTDLLAEWKPRKIDLAQFLEDAESDGARTILAIAELYPALQSDLSRLFQQCDDIGISNLVGTSDLWKAVSLAPMASLYAEQQLDTLIEAVAQGNQWKDPAEIFDPEENQEFDLGAIICLAQARIVASDGKGEALNLVMLRLLNHAGDESPS